MDLYEEYFNSFNDHDFRRLVNLLETKGYVIDMKDGFSSVQIKHMTEDMFKQLCKKFEIEANITYSKAGGYYPTEGGYSMIFNSDILDYNDAKRILDHRIMEE